MSAQQQQQQPSRLYLVPEDVVNNWRQNSQISAIDKPEDVSLATHRDSLVDAVGRDDMPPYAQNVLVEQRTGKFLNDRKLRAAKIWQPQLTPTPSPASGPVTSQSSPDESPNPQGPLKDIPKSYRAKAKRLLDAWAQDEEMEWDAGGNVRIRGKPLAGARLTDLLRHAVTRRKNAPRAFQDFSQYVKASAHNPALYLNPAYHVTRARSLSPPRFAQSRPRSLSPPRRAPPTSRRRGRTVERQSKGAAGSSDAWDARGIVKRWETLA
jgi:hypothetical protein